MWLAKPHSTYFFLKHSQNVVCRVEEEVCAMWLGMPMGVVEEVCAMWLGMVQAT